MMITKNNISLIRSVAQQVGLHPKWDVTSRSVLKVHFGLEDEQLDALHELFMWICDHGLEYLLEVEAA